MKRCGVYFSLALFLLLFIGQSVCDAKAESSEKGNTNSDKTEESSANVVNQDLTIEITVNLEDETVFMGISVYRIGEYNGENFVYSENVRSLHKKEYYVLDRESDQYEAAQTIADYIKETGEIVPVAMIDVKNGIGTVGELPVGLYLLMQNDMDYNSKLLSPFLVEAPAYSSRTSEYLYEIRLFPKWEKTVWFSFRPEVVNPLGLVIILLCCLLLALVGSKLFRVLSLSLFAVLFGFLGMKGALLVTNEHLWLMVIFVSTAFLGIGLLYGGYYLFVHRFISGNFKEKAHKQLIWITPILAFLIAAVTVKHYLSTDIIFWLVIPAVIAVIGFVLQLIGRKNHRNFYTYDDLLCIEEADARN